MNNLDKQYTDLLQDILDNGVEKKDRTGTGTISVFGRQIRHNMKDGFPLLTTKKMPFKTIVTELLWFLRGDTNIKYLVDNNCHIWDGDCYQAYLRECKKMKKDEKWLKEIDGVNIGTFEVTKIYWQFTKEEFINKIKTDNEFAKKWGELGPIYGKQWRNWETYFDKTKGWMPHNYDQIQNLINNLKTNPDSRRLMVNAWNVGELDAMVLPPCHYGFQVYTRELSDEERYKNFPELLEILSAKWDAIKRQEYANAADFRDKEKKYMVQNPQVENLPTRAISLMWNQRSVDTFLGLPFNIASYGLLLEIIAKEVNMIPDELIGNLGDTHLYLNHLEQAREQIGRDYTREERIKLYYDEYAPEMIIEDDHWMDAKLKTREIPKRTREPFPLPKLILNPIFFANLEHKGFDEAINGHINFQLEGYQSHPTIKAPLSN